MDSEQQDSNLHSRGDLSLIPGINRLLYHLSYAPCEIWSEQKDSNLYSPGYRPGALTKIKLCSANENRKREIELTEFCNFKLGQLGQLKSWSRRRDLNPHSSVYETDAFIRFKLRRRRYFEF